MLIKTTKLNTQFVFISEVCIQSLGVFFAVYEVKIDHVIIGLL